MFLNLVYRKSNLLDLHQQQVIWLLFQRPYNVQWLLASEFDSKSHISIYWGPCRSHWKKKLWKMFEMNFCYILRFRSSFGESFRNYAFSWKRHQNSGSIICESNNVIYVTIIYVELMMMLPYSRYIDCTKSDKICIPKVKLYVNRTIASLYYVYFRYEKWICWYEMNRRYSFKDDNALKKSSLCKINQTHTICTLLNVLINNTFETFSITSHTAWSIYRYD